jgi:putative Holliday junction resolvase
MTGPAEAMEQAQTGTGRVAGIDLGRARVGLALSDELGLLAHPRPPLDGSDVKRLVHALAALAREEGVVRFVVGLPLSLSGASTAGARRAARFCQALAQASGAEVELVDERLTTVEAERRLSEAGVPRRERRARIDGEAAAILLQQWLDTHRI